MKSSIIVFLLSFMATYSQSLPSDFMEALEYSKKFEFDGNNYKPTNIYNGNIQSNNIYDVMQARYDSGFYNIKNEIAKLFGLKLLNLKNKEYLKTYIIEREPIMKREFNSLDFSREENVNYAYQVVTQYITSKWKRGNYYVSNPIADEIKLLKKINLNYIRLINENPNGFFYTQRWKEIKLLIEELVNCEISEIPSLGIKYNVY